jgi:hypothetical protein
MIRIALAFIVSLSAYGAVNFIPDTKTATPQEAKRILSAGAKVNEIVASQCFADFMGKVPKANMSNGRSPAQVVEHLRSLKGDVPVKMYFKRWGCRFGCTSAVAFRIPPKTEINLNRSRFKVSSGDCDWAATMAHEGLGHALGNYGHSMKWTQERENTVPYLLGGRKTKNGGDAITACCK